jgi:hypothetical protein
VKRKRYLIAIPFIGVMSLFVWLLEKPAPMNGPADQNESKTTKQSIELGLMDKSVPDVRGGVPPSPRARNQRFQGEAEQLHRQIESEIAIWQAPILYFGRVVDENDQPIAGAQAAYGAQSMNQLREEVYDTGIVTTDERGIFKISEVRGVNLMVQVSHPDYYPYPTNSTGFDKRSVPRRGYFSAGEETAEVFRMHHKGNPVPLVHGVDGVDVPLGETSTVIELRGGEYSQKIGQLVIQASGDPPPRRNREQFNWNVKITIPGGGFIESTNQFDFVAPMEGYVPMIAFGFTKATVGWTDTVAKNYFVKLPTGYARLGVYIGAKRPLFFSIDYYFNPDGSRNVEPVN